jgi:hypothetical protein
MGDCTAKLRPFRPINETEVSCEKSDDKHDPHEGILSDYAHVGSETIIKWFETDRRTFHNEWPGDCETERCFLPLGHRGEHVILGNVDKWKE